VYVMMVSKGETRPYIQVLQRLFKRSPLAKVGLDHFPFRSLFLSLVSPVPS